MPRRTITDIDALVGSLGGRFWRTADGERFELRPTEEGGVAAFSLDRPGRSVAPAEAMMSEGARPLRPDELEPPSA